MHSKSVPLILLMIVSGLAGCIENLDADSDTTDDFIPSNSSSSNNINYNVRIT